MLEYLNLISFFSFLCHTHTHTLSLSVGTGLVGLGIGLLGASHVVLTDQEPLLELLQSNVTGAGLSVEQSTVTTLQWGGQELDEASIRAKGPYHVIIGSDLIYAHEAHQPLVTTFNQLSQLTTGVVIYLAVINRFKWEENFFEMMSENFRTSVMYEEQDIRIYRFERLLRSTATQASVINVERKTSDLESHEDDEMMGSDCRARGGPVESEGIYTGTMAGNSGISLEHSVSGENESLTESLTHPSELPHGHETLEITTAEWLDMLNQDRPDVSME